MAVYEMAVQCPRCGRDAFVRVHAEKQPRTLQIVAEVVMQAHFAGFHPKAKLDFRQVKPAVRVATE